MCCSSLGRSKRREAAAADQKQGPSRGALGQSAVAAPRLTAPMCRGRKSAFHYSKKVGDPFGPPNLFSGFSNDVSQSHAQMSGQNRSAAQKGPACRTQYLTAPSPVLCIQFEIMPNVPGPNPTPQRPALCAGIRPAQSGWVVGWETGLNRRGPAALPCSGPPPRPRARIPLWWARRGDRSPRRRSAHGGSTAMPCAASGRRSSPPQ